jgi:hypothetical protein
MEKKKILIVSRFFYPENTPRSFRTTELAKEFARQGHEVKVLIPSKSDLHNTFSKENNFTIKDIGSPRWQSPNFGNSKIGYWMTRAFYRILSLGFEYPGIELMFLVKKALKMENGYDLLISIAVPYPIHWGVALRRSNKKRIAKIWVADCGDPYMGDKTDSFRKLFYFKYVEKWFMTKADYISITKMEFKVNYYEEFHHKIVEIPQGFKFEDVKLFEGTPLTRQPHFAFAGSLIKGVRDPSLFLAYLISLEQDYKFILYTKTTELVEPFVAKSKGRIEIKDYISRTELLYELSKMDFLVNFEYNPVIQSPSKLIDYGLTRKPILNSISKEFKPTIIDEFLHGNYTNQFQIPDFDKYRIENVCASFLNLTN